MDFGWTTYFNGFWLFPLLCFFFMAAMMIACFFGMRFLGHRGSPAGCCGNADARREQCHTAAPDAKA